MEHISFSYIFTLYTNKEYEVDRITKLLDIMPSKVWKKDAGHSKPLYRDESFWQLSSQEIYSITLEESFLKFIDQFNSKGPLIRKIIEEEGFACKIYVVIKIHSGNIMPGIYLSAQTLSMLSSLYCALDLDIYDYRE